MIVSLADYRALSGDVVSTDAGVGRTILRYQALIEGFLDRRLELATVANEKHSMVTPAPLLLRRYPITEITSVTADGGTVDHTEFNVNEESGIVYHNNLLNWKRKVLITYRGGYDPLPADLQYVVCTLVEARLKGEVDDVRPVRKETVYGVQSIDYATGSHLEAYGQPYAELGAYVSILERYRRADELGLA